MVLNNQDVDSAAKQPTRYKKSGGRKLSDYPNISEAKAQKMSCIVIRSSPNCGGALIMGMGRQGDVKMYQKMRNAQRSIGASCVDFFQYEAEKLHSKAGVSITAPTSLDKIAAFQAILPQFQIKVWGLAKRKESDDTRPRKRRRLSSTPSLLYKGPASDKVIDLLYDENEHHYDVITSPAAFFGFKYYYPCCDLLVDACERIHNRRCPRADHTNSKKPAGQVMTS